MIIDLHTIQKIKITGADDVFQIMISLLAQEEEIDRDREHFWVISLAPSNRILTVELISMGGVQRTTVEPIQVFRSALMYGAEKIILIHNHPSGEIEPSEADIGITDRLIQAGLIVDIIVEDHIIITAHSYLSFVCSGLMEKLERSLKYVPPYLLEKHLLAEAERIRSEENLHFEQRIPTICHQVKCDIAQRAARMGLSVTQIIALTGLAESDIIKQQ